MLLRGDNDCPGPNGSSMSVGTAFVLVVVDAALLPVWEILLNASPSNCFWMNNCALCSSEGRISCEELSNDCVRVTGNLSNFFDNCRSFLVCSVVVVTVEDLSVVVMIDVVSDGSISLRNMCGDGTGVRSSASFGGNSLVNSSLTVSGESRESMSSSRPPSVDIASERRKMGWG